MFTTFRGWLEEVKDADGTVLTCLLGNTHGSGDREYLISPGCKVTRNGEESDLSALTAGDKLEIFGQPATKITATEDPVAAAAEQGFRTGVPSPYAGVKAEEKSNPE